MKRVIAFLVLIAAGVFALWFAVGDDAAVRANGGDSDTKPAVAPKRPQSTRQPSTRPQSTRQPGGPGVQLGGNGGGAKLSQLGKLVYPKDREIQLGGGRTRKERVFVLRAEDSRPIGDGLQQMSDVTLKLFDKGVHAATVIAREAFVELGRDPNGEPTFVEQKKIDVRDCVITAEPGSQLEGLRLEIGDATIFVGDNEVQLNTEATQFVTMIFEGRQSVQLTGRGANVRLPRSSEGGLQKAEITIQTEPVLVTDDMVVQASGRMRYVEDTVTGAAHISLDDNVELKLTHGALKLPGTASADLSNAAKKAESTIRGDQFTGWLLRNKNKAVKSDPNDKSRGDIGWQRLVLVGAPATIDAPGLHVTTPRIMARPGPLGDPFIVTTYGGESRIEQTKLFSAKQEALVVTTATRRIHFAHPGNSAGALHRAMGFPQWTIRSLEQQQIVIYEGAAKFESGARKMTASDGLVVYARATGETGVVQGFGDVEVFEAGAIDAVTGERRPDLMAKGNDGMLLTIAKSHQQLQLGLAADQKSTRWREHRYSVSYGAASVSGLGACRVRRTGERTTLELRAPFDEIQADFDEEGTQLRNVRQLLATLEGKVVTDLDVGGLPVRATFQKNDEVLQAQAPRLRQIGPQSMRLLPMELDESPWSEMTALDRTPRLLRTWKEAKSGGPLREHSVEVVGPRIDVHHVGGRHAIIDAHAQGEDLPRIYAKVPQPGSSEPATVTCAAVRLRVLPFALPKEVRRMYFGGASGLIPNVVMHSLAKPWLLVDDVRDFQLDDEQQGHITGSGHRLFISQGGKALLFVGNPDEQSPAIVRRSFEGRTVIMEGARVRVSNDSAVRLAALGSFDDRSTFMPPTMTLHETGSNGLLSNMRAVCLGDIQVDPEAVRFGGPVEAHGLRPDGQDDPDGINIDAKKLTMRRITAGEGPALTIGKAGDISLIEGKDVVIDWTKLDARAADIKIDVLRGHCTASDSNGAVVTLPDGRTLRSNWTFVNYKTWSFRTGASSVMQPKTAVVDPDAADPNAATAAGGSGQEGQL
ncbi:MAG: hypothetical protein ACI85K_000992 [Hyphomicrobiaceae bacterium]